MKTGVTYRENKVHKTDEAKLAAPKARAFVVRDGSQDPPDILLLPLPPDPNCGEGESRTGVAGPPSVFRLGTWNKVHTEFATRTFGSPGEP